MTAINDGVLPGDILHEVLLGLPAKDLCRLRLVCTLFPPPPLIAGLCSNKDEVHIADLSGNIKRVPITGDSFVSAFDDYEVLCIVRHYKNNRFVQTSYVTTLNGGGDDRRWRASARLAVPVDPRFRQRAVVGEVAYFLFQLFSPDYVVYDDVEPDSIASFDMAKEEWNKTTIRGPLSLSSSLLSMAGERLGV
ncbi:hypothetical protein HU200_015931 [Digitaria exilis]|uniref:F-box domain-containing protein n=1 Tax=Digitaria exilis TaxID=1010633 RepID=A0A835KHQ2_9POAL|nr:hypothetical protein HU200_015931 [Digitaria exilis]